MNIRVYSRNSRAVLLALTLLEVVENFLTKQDRPDFKQWHTAVGMAPKQNGVMAAQLRPLDGRRIVEAVRCRTLPGAPCPGSLAHTFFTTRPEPIPFGENGI